MHTHTHTHTLLLSAVLNSPLPSQTWCCESGKGSLLRVGSVPGGVCVERREKGSGRGKGKKRVVKM